MKGSTSLNHTRPLAFLSKAGSFGIAVALIAINSMSIRADLVAHWTFDEAGGTVAHDSAGGLDGTLSPSGAGFVAGGISSNAISLNRAANGFVNMGNLLSLTGGDFTVVAWVKMSPGDITPDTMILGKHEGGSVNGYFLLVNQSGGAGQNNKALFYAGGLVADGPVSKTNVNDGNWHQVVGVYKSGVTKVIYVDGVAQGTNSAPAINGNTAAFLIGGINQSGVPTSFFTGLVDDVQVYTSALSSSDILYLFQNPGKVVGAPIPTVAPVAHWTFDEVSGTVAHDSAGGLDGNLSPSGAVFVAGGISGNAVSLSRAANGFVNMGNVLSLTGGDFSVVAWVKMNPGDTTADTAIVAKHESGSVNGYFLLVNQGGGGGQNNKASFYAGGLVVDSPVSHTSVNDGSWHQVVGVYKSGLNKFIYVDGVAEGTNSAPVINGNTAAFLVGGVKESGAPTGRFTGLVDDVQVYDRALSADDIRYLFQNPGKVGVSPPTVAPLAHWAFDEAGGTVAHDSAGGLDGTLSPAGASFVAGGVSGNAVSLNRATNGFVNMGNVLSLTSGDFSVVAWVKMNPGDTTPETIFVGKHEGGSVNGYYLVVNQSGGAGQNNKATFYAGGLVADGPVSTTSVNDGNWHQVVGVYKSGVNKLIYVDGVAQGTNSAPAINGNTAAFLIGGINQSGVPSGRFTGLIDDVQVYNRTLSSSEILFLFQNPGRVLGAPPSGAPLAHWTFDEVGGTLAHDSAGGLDGTLSPTGARFVAGGISSNAVSLSRATNGFVNMGNVLSLTSGDFSVVAWVKMNPGDTTPDTMILGKHEGGSVNGYFLLVNQSGGGGQNNKASFYAGGLVVDSPVSQTSVNDGNWHQVVGVYKSGVNKVIYVDGVAQGTNSAPAINGNTAAFLVGGINQSGVPTGYFTGLVDDVQVYGKAVSPADILYLFQNPGKTLPALSQPCTAPPSGLVGWWKGEANALDQSGTNNGSIQGNATFGAGRVGQGFVFDGNGDGVVVGNPTSLQLQDFTIEAWIKRASTAYVSSGPGLDSVFFSYGSGGYGFGLDRNGGRPVLSVIDVNSVTPTANVTVADTNFHHLAVTKLGTNVIFYVDGVAYAAPSYSSTFSFTTSAAIGATGDGLRAGFYGSVDELAVYNRALSAVEIQAIYNTGSAGKCTGPTPPFILSQPTNQTVVAGETATFAVMAGGTAPLSYQWSFNGTNINGATGSSIVLTNVQFANAGDYSVVVSNSAGTRNSSNAVLTVNPLPSCVPPAAGLVSLWRAEGNLFDDNDGNNAVLMGNVTYGSGKVGQGFVFDGNGDGAFVGNPANLRLQDFTIEAWISRASTAYVSSGPGLDSVFFSYGSGGYGFGLDRNGGRPVLSVIDVSSVTPTANVTVSDTNFHHLAVTKLGANVIFYVDGVGYAAPSYPATFSFTTPAAIGATGDGLRAGFYGSVDELAVYNRALGANEIQAIYGAGIAGKCALPPTIQTQPASQTIRVGTNVTFNAVATGAKPLSYQWRFNSTNTIIGATNASLTLTNVQAAANGSYTVVISNSLDSITSAPAKLEIRYLFAFGNGQNLTNTQYTFVGSVSIQLQTFFTNGALFYALDGSQPSFASAQYTGPFTVTQSSLLRIITYSSDFLQSWELDPISLTIIPTYSLQVSAGGGGTVSVIPTNGPYMSNSVVNVTATPASGWTFLGWLGDASGTNTTISVTMNRNKLVQARFGTALSTTVAGNGAVTLIPPGGLYPFGTVVQLYAVPLSGNYFALWGNAGSGSSNPLSFVLTNANPTVSSLFASLGAGEFALTVIPNGFGQVMVNPPANRYTSGQNVTLTSAPDAGQQFLNWSGDASGTSSPLIVVMNQTKTITANFTRRPSLGVLGGLGGLNEQGFRLTLTGEFGGHYRIDGSTNLLAWVQLVTLTNTFGTAQFTDEAATNVPLRFYKAVTVP